MSLRAQLAAPVTLDGVDVRLAGAALLAGGALLSVAPDGAGLPCPLRSLTGIPCPLCGMTTSVVSAIHLDFAGALAANPLGLAAVAAAIVLLVRKPRRLSIPARLPIVALAAAWVFELHRFALL